VSAEEAGYALERVAEWRSDPDAPLACPRCGRTGLAIVDRSARPYAEWYAISCPSCGFEHTLHLPLPPPAGDLD
jgi:predicted RNA-binding Zn-ribbon protein involved in translation (DUF1610 family)